MNPPKPVALGPAPTITDPTYTPKERLGLLDRVCVRLINDPRDLPFCRFIVEATLVLFPAAVALFVFPFRWWAAALYLAVLYLNYVDRYVLVLHCTSHRELFKAPWGLLNHYIPWVLGPLHGESPETYYGHHIGMHHPENNLGDDLSTTLPFERDRAAHWLQYFGTFISRGLFDLTRYHLARGKTKMARNIVVGELGYVAFVVALALVNFRATLVVCIIPVFVTRFLMMAGNWAQHAFVDGTDPANPFKNSITCINTRYNRRSFNDGYHIGHHRLATRHWTELPVEFLRDLQKYADNDAILFDGIDFTTVWFLLMLHRYDVLADHFVELRAQRRSREEIVELLKSRTRPVEAPKRKPRLRGAAAAAA